MMDLCVSVLRHGKQIGRMVVGSISVDVMDFDQRTQPNFPANTNKKGMLGAFLKHRLYDHFAMVVGETLFAEDFSLVANVALMR